MSLSDFGRECPTCGSAVKSERDIIQNYYGQKIFCTDNWHWVTLSVTAPPKGFEWTVDDDIFLKRMDLGFDKPLEQIMREYSYLRP